MDGNNKLQNRVIGEDLDLSAKKPSNRADQHDKIFHDVILSFSIVARPWTILIILQNSIICNENSAGLRSNDLGCCMVIPGHKIDSYLVQI